MSKNIVETVNSRIDELISARNAEIEATKQKLEDAKAVLADAQALADHAISAADLEMYSSARADEEKATRAVELYSARLEQLESKGFVDAAEDARIIAQLQRYQRDLLDSTTAEIISLMSSIEKIGKKYYTLQDTATKTFKRWNDEISGEFAFEEIKDGELRHAIRHVVTGYFYRKELDVDQYHGTGPIWTK